MQFSDNQILTSIRLLLFLMLLFLIFVTTRKSSEMVVKAWRLPIIYPHDDEDSEKRVEERESLLKELSTRWALYTVLDYSLGIFIAYELLVGFSEAGYGLTYYIQVHLPSAVVVSFGVGSILAVIVAKFRSPFQSGKIQPLKHLVENLESLVNAVHVGGAEASEDTEAILLRILRQEIERFIEFRKMGDAECGRLLEYLAGIEGVVGWAASTILWP